MATTLTNTDIRASYIPEIYSPTLKENMRDATMLTRITNTEFQGKFRNKGDTIIVRKTPLIETKKYIDGKHIAYEDPTAEDEKFTIDRARYYAFRVHDINQALSDIPNFAGTWTKEGAVQLAEDMETEFFSEVYTQVDTANAGNSAGRISGNYDLGSVAHPLQLFKTSAEASSSYQSSVVDAIAACAGALDEQKGGKNARPWLIIPSAVAVRIQTSEMKDASMTGDAKSIIRLGVESIGSIGGMDIYRSNLIYKWTDGTNSKPTFACLFGDNSAITFANEISKTEMLRDTDSFSDLHRSLCVYDWFVRWPERIGCMVCQLG